MRNPPAIRHKAKSLKEAEAEEQVGDECFVDLLVDMEDAVEAQDRVFVVYIFLAMGVGGT